MPTARATCCCALRTLRRLPEFLSRSPARLAADFIARFSALVASAPWPQFTFEVNPLKLGHGTRLSRAWTGCC